MLVTYIAIALAVFCGAIGLELWKPQNTSRIWPKIAVVAILSCGWLLMAIVAVWVLAGILISREVA